MRRLLVAALMSVACLGPAAGEEFAGVRALGLAFRAPAGFECRPQAASLTCKDSLDLASLTVEKQGDIHILQRLHSQDEARQLALNNARTWAKHRENKGLVRFVARPDGGGFETRRVVGSGADRVFVGEWKLFAAHGQIMTVVDFRFMAENGFFENRGEPAAWFSKLSDEIFSTLIDPPR